MSTGLFQVGDVIEKCTWFVSHFVEAAARSGLTFSPPGLFGISTVNLTLLVVDDVLTEESEAAKLFRGLDI